MLVHCQQKRRSLIQSLIFALFSYQRLIALFTRVLFGVTVYYYCVTYASELVVRRCSVKKAFLELLQNSQEKTCATVSFLNNSNFAKFLRTPFVAEHLQWMLLAFHSQSTLHIFTTSCLKLAQNMNFNRIVTSWKYVHPNIVQTSSFCYLVGFQIPSMKFCSGKEMQINISQRNSRQCQLFLLIFKILKHGTLPQTFKSNFNSIFQSSSCLILV